MSVGNPAARSAPPGFVFNGNPAAASLNQALILLSQPEVIDRINTMCASTRLVSQDSLYHSNRSSDDGYPSGDDADVEDCDFESSQRGSAPASAPASAQYWAAQSSMQQGYRCKPGSGSGLRG